MRTQVAGCVNSHWFSSIKKIGSFLPAWKQKNTLAVVVNLLSVLIAQGFSHGSSGKCITLLSFNEDDLIIYTSVLQNTTCNSENNCEAVSLENFTENKNYKIIILSKFQHDSETTNHLFYVLHLFRTW